MGKFLFSLEISKFSLALQPKALVNTSGRVLFSSPDYTTTIDALLPIYLHKVDFAWLLVYNQSLTTASESRLFGSVVRALVLYWGDPGSIPSEGTRIFSAMLYFVTVIMS